MYPGLSAEELRVNLARFDELRNWRRIPRTARRLSPVPVSASPASVAQSRAGAALMAVRRHLRLRPAPKPA
jgi:hypothetical protein